MPIPALLQFIVWSCFALSVVTMIALAILLVTVEKTNVNDLVGSAAITAIELVVMASTSCTLVLLGHSVSALFVWRMASISLFLFSLWPSIRSFGASVRAYGSSFFESRPAARFVTIAASAGAFFFAITSLLVPTLPYIGGKYLDGQAVASIHSPLFANQVNVSEVAPCVVLSVACFVFAILFILASRNEGPLSFERSGGGLGAGTGGWEISSSLTYLLATIATATLLLVLTFHKDQLEDAREQRKAEAVSKAETGKNASQSAGSSSARVEKPGSTAAPAAAGKESAADKPALKPGDHPNAD